MNKSGWTSKLKRFIRALNVGKLAERDWCEMTTGLAKGVAEAEGAPRRAAPEDGFFICAAPAADAAALGDPDFEANARAAQRRGKRQASEAGSAAPAVAAADAAAASESFDAVCVLRATVLAFRAIIICGWLRSVWLRVECALRLLCGGCGRSAESERDALCGHRERSAARVSWAGECTHSALLIPE